MTFWKFCVHRYSNLALMSLFPVQFCLCKRCILCLVEKNTLSFIETSALDSTNVEGAFTHILTGV